MTTTYFKDPVVIHDGFRVGQRVRYANQLKFEYAHRDTHTDKCPPNDFVIRRVCVDGRGVHLSSLDGVARGVEETFNLEPVRGADVRLFQVLDDARESMEPPNGKITLDWLMQYVREFHDATSAISFADLDDNGLAALLYVWLVSRDLT